MKESASDCPPAQLLNDFAQGMLNSTSIETVDRHTQKCARCRRLLRRIQKQHSGQTENLRLFGNERTLVLDDGRDLFVPPEPAPPENSRPPDSAPPIHSMPAAVTTPVFFPVATAIAFPVENSYYHPSTTSLPSLLGTEVLPTRRQIAVRMLSRLSIVFGLVSIGLVATGTMLLKFIPLDDWLPASTKDAVPQSSVNRPMRPDSTRIVTTVERMPPRPMKVSEKLFVRAKPFAILTQEQDQPLSERLVRLQSSFALRSKRDARNGQGVAELLAQHRIELRHLAEEGGRAANPDHRALANIYADLFQWERVSEHAVKALNNGPADESLCSLQIGALVASGNFDAAERCLNEARRLFPNSSSLSVQELGIDQGRLFELSRHNKVDEIERSLPPTREKLEIVRKQLPSHKSQLEVEQRTSDKVANQSKATGRHLDLVGKRAFTLSADTWFNSSPLSMEVLRGKVVVIDFWAVWCGPCVMTLPHLQHWHDQFVSKGLVIVGLTNYCQCAWDDELKRPRRAPGLTREKEDAAMRAFLKHHELKYPIAISNSRDVSTNYLVGGIPQLVVIDRQGVIRMIRVGSGEKNVRDLEACIQECLAAK
jgi:thiol-disulfide isomerase/thioredoxin